MSSVKISDILVPSIWTPYMQEKTKELSALWGAGIIDQNSKYDELASGPGTVIDMPFFQDLTGESEVLSDTNPLGVNKIGAAKDVSRLHKRGKAWGANDLAGALSGTDPMAAIGDLVAAWWARDFQKILLANLKGIFATALASTHVLDVSIATGNTAVDANKINSDTVISAFDKLGDSSAQLTAIAMHSGLYHNLLKQNVIEFEQPSDQGEPIQRYLGRRIIVDDTMPRVAAATNGVVYTSYLFGTNAFAYGEGTPDESAETDRDILAGENYLVNRRHFLLHPKGVKFTGTPAGVSPTNTELETAASWTRVYEVKNVPIVALRTNG